MGILRMVALGWMSWIVRSVSQLLALMADRAERVGDDERFILRQLLVGLGKFPVPARRRWERV